MNKIPKLKREEQEQICEYATRVNQIYNTLQRLHPTNTYPDEVKQSDSIRKLLEVLPQSDRKWIKISDPVANTFWDVLRQILEYVEVETNLKLTIEDIERETKLKPGAVEVNNSQDTTGKKSADVNTVFSGKGAIPKSSKQGGKQSSSNSTKQCHYCKIKGHIQSECRKKKYAEANKSVSKPDSYQKSYSNDSSFKFSPNLQSSQGIGDNKPFMRCSFCNIKGHLVAECRFKQKAEYNNNGGTLFKVCKYCKCAGHLIEECKKRMYKEQNWNGDKFLGQIGTSSYKPNLRKCYKCGEIGEHIAKFCPKNF